MRASRIPWMPLLLGWVLGASPLAVLAVESMGIATVPESGIAVMLEGWAGISPHMTSGRDAGFVQVTVTITNGSSSDREWTLDPAPGFGNGTGMVPSIRLAVPAGGVGRETLYVDPGASNSGGGVWVRVRGFGLAGGEQRFKLEAWNPAMLSAGVTGPSQPVFPAAISRAAFLKRGTAIEEYHFTGGLGLDLTAAPEDWRGWSVFSCCLLDESDWIAMSASQRKAFLDWVGLGGIAGVLVTDASTERLDQIGWPVADPAGRRRVGAGEIVPLPWDGMQLTPADVEAFLHQQSLHPRSDQLSQYSYANGSLGADLWEGGFTQLYGVFGPRRLPIVAILCFLVVFGLVAGPVNLLVFARPGRRARMFWTTPLISLVATLLLLGLIFLRDGIGGAGARRVLCLLMPEQNGMAIIQEQFSRTGVLLGNSFPIEEPSWMRPLGRGAIGRGLLEVEGKQREGDWFSSRADQGFLLETVRPSRAKVELIANGPAPPAVISSVDVPLDRLFVIDEQGEYWTARDVGTGERKSLERSDEVAYAEWFRSIAADAGPIRASALERVRNRAGNVYAETSAARDVALATLGSIRWIDEKAVFIGPVTRTNTP